MSAENVIFCDTTCVDIPIHRPQVINFSFHFYPTFMFALKDKQSHFICGFHLRICEANFTEDDEMIQL